MDPCFQWILEVFFFFNFRVSTVWIINEDVERLLRSHRTSLVPPRLEKHPKPKTNSKSAPENRPKPKGTDHLPTIDFQGRTVSLREGIWTIFTIPLRGVQHVTVVFFCLILVTRSRNVHSWDPDRPRFGFFPLRICLSKAWWAKI